MGSQIEPQRRQPMELEHIWPVDEQYCREAVANWDQKITVE
jgi:hypothetical protein